MPALIKPDPVGRQDRHVADNALAADLFAARIEDRVFHQS